MKGRYDLAVVYVLVWSGQLCIMSGESTIRSRGRYGFDKRKARLKGAKASLTKAGRCNPQGGGAILAFMTCSPTGRLLHNAQPQRRDSVLARMEQA